MAATADRVPCVFIENGRVANWDPSAPIESETINTVEEETGRLNSAFEQLGESWQDQQRASFEETFKQLLNALQNFKDNASEQIPHLRTMAEDLSTYLGR